MSDVILTDITIFYLDENRQKRVHWTGGATTKTLNAVYSAFQDHFDESAQLNDGSILSAQTPVEYSIGKIDSGDNDPWYISYECMEHITNGALRTTGWTRVQDSNTGIVVVPVVSAGRTIVTADIGYTVTHDDLDSGTLLDIIDVGETNDYLVIRPDDDTAANNFDSVADDITSDRGAFTAAQAAASTTGEQIWANLYSIGTIESASHIYGYQGPVAVDGERARTYSIVDQTQDWWGDGHIDICVPIRDYKTDTNPIVDGGYVSIFARKGGTLYANFEVACSITSGGRNPIPLGTGVDLNNTTGYKQITLTGLSGSHDIGDEIQGNVSDARAILTKVSGTPVFEYYLIDDPQTDFDGSEATTNNTQTGASSGSGASTDAGPALATWFTNNTPPTLVFTTAEADISGDDVNETYGILIHCQDNPLTEVYEYLKYITQRGNTADIDPGASAITGESYVGCEAFLKYTGSPSGTINEGSDVTQETSGATGVIVSHDETNKEILLRDVRGTFGTGASDHTLTSNDDTETVEIDSIATNFAPKNQSPFGTFAGGTFFGARGVYISDWVSADENSFQLTDSGGTIRIRPIANSLTVSNLIGTDETTITDDRVAVFRLDVNGDIDKTEYSSSGAGAAGDPTLIVDGSITDDTPGKSAGGVLRIRDESNNNKEYRIRFASWVTATFTLANFAAFVSSGGDENTIIYATGGFDGTVKRGDLVYNSTQGEVSYVISVDNDTTLQVAPDFTLTSSGDTLEINCLPIAMDTLDDVYVSLLEVYALGATMSASIIYVSNIDFKAVVRNVEATDPDGPLVPFASTDTMTNADKSVATIRTLDTIYT